MFLQRRNGINTLFFLAILIMSASCTVRNYPKQKPFVYKNIINVKGDIPKGEKIRLQTELSNYWDDSIKVKSVTTFGVFTSIKNPPVYDSSHLNSSIAFMQSFLKAQGFYNAIITPSLPPKIDTVKGDQYRTTVELTIDVQRNLHINTFSFDSLLNTDLQQIAKAHLNESLLKSGKPFTKQLIASELDRLLILYRKNGFFKLSLDNLYAEVDTSYVGLLDLSLDPFEQARVIAQATEARKKNPTIDVYIRERPSADSNSFVRYYIGNIYYYPQAKINLSPDSLMRKNFPITFSRREFTSKQDEAFIHFRPLREHTFLRKGILYNEDNYFKTVNAFNQLGAWSQVDVKVVPGIDSSHILDFHFFLTPAVKYYFGSDLEVSRNSGIINGNLLGIANVLTIRNRNVWKESIQSSTSFRVGVEFGLSDSIKRRSPLQTFQATLSQTFSIPRFITPWPIKSVKKLDAYKTIVNLNASYIERQNFYRLKSFVSSFGYEWKRKNHVWLYKPLSIELYSLDTLIGLRAAFFDNPFLRTAFNTGYVVSQNLSYIYTFPGKRDPSVSNYIRGSVEEAGLLLGNLTGLRDKIYRYVKFEGEFRQSRKFIKNEFAYRLSGGIGYNYSNDPQIGRSLPFFKQFIAGGPNSMRAWPVRQLGLGSSLLSDTAIRFRERFGDIQLEANIEYRIYLTTIGGVKIGTALFADIGNIWNLKNNIENPGSKLELRRFGRDIAIAAGFGVLRLDFNYFLIRLDFAYKVKDPARIKNTWMSIKDFEWRNKEFEIRDSNGRRLIRNNYALQLGIGVPF